MAAVSSIGQKGYTPLPLPTGHYDHKEKKGQDVSKSKVSQKRKSTKTKPDLIQQISIQRLKLPQKQQASITKAEDSIAAISSVVDKIMESYAAEKIKQKKEISSEEITIREHPDNLSGFHCKPYVLRNRHISAIGQYLKRKGAQGEYQSSTVYYLFFFYRCLSTAQKTSGIGKKELGDKERPKNICLYALTTGDAWQVVRKYVDYTFPGCIAKRLMYPEIDEARSEQLSGPKRRSIELFRKPTRPSLMECLERRITSFISSFKINCSIYRLSAFNGEDSPINVSYKEGMLRIKRELQIPELAEVLALFSKIYFNQEVTETVGSPPTVEIDDPYFEFLDYIQPLPDDCPFLNLLDFRFEEKLFHAFLGEGEDLFELRPRYYQDFMAAQNVLLVRGIKNRKEIAIWRHTPTFSDFTRALENHEPEESSPSFANFKKTISKLKIEFRRKGEPYSARILLCIEGEIRHEQNNYFKLGGKWYYVSARYTEVVEHEFLSTIKSSLLSEDHPAHLPEPWMCSEKWAHFTAKDITDITGNPSLTLQVTAAIKKNLLPSKNGKTKLILKIQPTLPEPLIRLLSLEKSKALTTLFEERVQLYQKYKKEKDEYDYNQQYSKRPNFIVGDRILTDEDKIEFFDIAYHSKDELFLYVVKEGFNRDMRVVRSQMVSVARQLREALNRGQHEKNNIIRKFFRIAEDWAKPEGEKLCDNHKEGIVDKWKEFSSAVKGKTGEDAFYDLFSGAKTITFVCAFIDNTNEEEKLFINLITPITVKELEDQPFMKNASFTGQGLLQELSKQEIIKNNKLAHPNQDNFVQNFNLPGSNRGQRQEIHRFLKRRIPKFDSVIAKTSLIAAKSEIEGLGFGFKICQIRRPKNSKGWGIKVPPLGFPSTKPSTTKGSSKVGFTFKGKKILPHKTKPDGACALHALLGLFNLMEGEGEYVYEPEEPHDRSIADKLKKELIQDLLPKVSEEQNSSFTKLVMNAIGDLLERTIKNPEDQNAASLLNVEKRKGFTESLEKLRKKSAQIKENEGDEFTQWLELFKDERAKEMGELFNKKLCALEASFEQQREANVAEAILVIHDMRKLLYEMLSKNEELEKIAASSIKKTEQERGKLKIEYERLLDQFKLIFFKKGIISYIRALQDERYNLTDTESQIAANLKHKQKVGDRAKGEFVRKLAEKLAEIRARQEQTPEDGNFNNLMTRAIGDLLERTIERPNDRNSAALLNVQKSKTFIEYLEKLREQKRQKNIREQEELAQWLDLFKNEKAKEIHDLFTKKIASVEKGRGRKVSSADYFSIICSIRNPAYAMFGKNKELEKVEASIKETEQERGKLQTAYEKLFNQFKDAFIQKAIGSYFKTIKNKDYYLTDVELEIAGILYNKKICLLSRQRGDVFANISIEISKDTVVIYNKNNIHFERCTVETIKLEGKDKKENDSSSQPLASPGLQKKTSAGVKRKDGTLNHWIKNKQSRTE